MASVQLPIDPEGKCMSCNQTPDKHGTVICATCGSAWHLPCLTRKPRIAEEYTGYDCPDCSGDGMTGAPAPSSGADLVHKIKAINEDASLTEKEKAKKKQEVVGGKIEEGEGKGKDKEKGNEALDLLTETFNCSFCMKLPERPVTTPCGHNFCLTCFQKWVGNGKRSCAKCRRSIPDHMAKQPRINSGLVATIRRARMLTTYAGATATEQPQRISHSLKDEDLPDEPYVTERAKKNGIANAKSGRIFVDVPSDHFGPIEAKSDPVMNMGILVGQCFANRYKSRQWGVHRPLVCGISGQSDVGAQSVVLSGGYEDDEDHGEWFLYTGSGGRDLSGNKRTTNVQSSDQEFKNFNESLRVSCKEGHPVRVIRSCKERSSYAPDRDLRYDGIYRIEKCWRKNGIQGFKVCRYLFIRCDNEAAPWTCDEDGDRPRPLPVVDELKDAIEIFERTESPSWDYDEESSCWKWMKQPPRSKSKTIPLDPEFIRRAQRAVRRAQHASMRVELLKEFNCVLCEKTMKQPVTTPCAHNFCKSCLEETFSGQAFLRERKGGGGRQLRSKKNIMKCPSCPLDISYFLQNIQVNSELMSAIEKLQAKLEEEAKELDIENVAETEVASTSSSGEGTEGNNLKRKASSDELSDDEAPELSGDDN